ncbi:hypothetical protein L2E82_15759 [Cichorium intybus]|uniref:Uncharacterized protein n=1 Tax=Cichorium intybus TaxID=13427 RepID=A0ACB9F4Y1_CICIN|nr:hypothetical protein L2E82_15759 [Cichorium intybus]
MRSSTRMEVNDTKSDMLHPTLNVLGSNFVYNDDVLPVPLTIHKSIITPKSSSQNRDVSGECNGTDSDACLNHQTIVYNDDDSSAPLTTGRSITSPKIISQDTIVTGESNDTESEELP